MINQPVHQQALRLFEARFGRRPSVAAYAPGRIEVLGNHTDYNEGYVLSAAIDCGTFFLAAPAADRQCRLVAGDLGEEVQFDLSDTTRARTSGWSNYVKGVSAGLHARFRFGTGFHGLFLGNIPLGAGLSSSAALEISSALALCGLHGVDLEPLELAKVGQAAEHEYAGVKCGLMDQITSLFGREHALVLSDFRTLAVETVPLGGDVCFLMFNTGVKHALVDGEYNRRRARCEEAARAFASLVGHPVKALRDVSWAEWERYAPRMDSEAARRSAHVIGENARVLRGRERLGAGDFTAFGRLMFESHRSSREQFENSCPELDFLVEAAEKTPGVLGARLSGGGFGGSVVVLTHPRDADPVGRALAGAYRKTHPHPCEVRTVVPSAGANRI